MGAKILRLQFLVRCVLQLIKGGGGGGGNSNCWPSSGFHQEKMKMKMKKQQVQPTTTRSSIIKLIRSDGVVKIYEQPIQVSELMLEFPKHMVCSSDCFYIGHKIPALSEHHQLRPGNSYFLLPNHLFHSVLSFVTITSFINASSSQCQSSSEHLKKALLSCRQPFHIQKTPSGYLRVNVSEDLISQLMTTEDQRNNKQNHHHYDDASDNTRGGSRLLTLCTTPQLQKHYAQLVAPPRHWKPKLETIKEIRENRKDFYKERSPSKIHSPPPPPPCKSHKTRKSSSVSSQMKIKGFLAKTSRKQPQQRMAL